MSRKEEIADLLEEIEEGVRGINKDEETDPYAMARVTFFQNKVIISMLEDVSERLKLVETALGLIAERNKEQ